MTDENRKPEKYEEFTVPVFPEFDGERILTRKYDKVNKYCLILMVPVPRNDEEAGKYTKATSLDQLLKWSVAQNAYKETFWDKIKETGAPALLEDMENLVKGFESALSETPTRQPGARAAEKQKAVEYDAAITAVGGAEELAKILAAVKAGKIKIK